MITYALSAGSYGRQITPAAASAIRQSKFRNFEPYLGFFAEENESTRETAQLMRQLIREGGSICYIIDLKKKNIYTLGELDSFDRLEDRHFIYVRPIKRKDRQISIMYCNCNHKPEVIDSGGSYKIQCGWCKKETPYYKDKEYLIDLWNEMVVTYDPNIKVKLTFSDGSEWEI